MLLIKKSEHCNPEKFIIKVQMSNFETESVLFARIKYPFLKIYFLNTELTH